MFVTLFPPVYSVARYLLKGYSAETQVNCKKPFLQKTQVKHRQDRIRVSMVARQANPPVVLASHIGTCSCPSCSTSYPAQELRKQQMTTQVLGSLQPYGRLERSSWLLTGSAQFQDLQLFNQQIKDPYVLSFLNLPFKCLFFFYKKSCRIKIMEQQKHSQKHLVK